jgi:hypothetical protein
MTQIHSMQQVPMPLKQALVRELGYETDGEFVLTQDGSRYHDPYVGCPVRLDNMAILQGSAIIIDDNPVSLDSYMEAHPGAL